MTAKLAGAALIVAGAVWCCAARRRRQRQRLTLAQALAQALSAMETGIRWQRRPMPQLLAQLAQRPVCGTYFDAVREMLQSDMPLQSAWNRAFSRIPDAETAEVLRRMELGGDETRLLTQLEDARQALMRCKLYKSFRMSYWGWMDFHTALVVLPEEKVSTNRSGHSAAQVLNQGLFHKQKKKLFRKERAL